ncbi:uncharacterized protein LOC120996577 [Bufo bufo]|uniref:uncharacterized protein LOC120996577 n=1 Tax=Bufo bufo TaxID=8384 RepID=UPI001ABE76DC|nr:uncharacterized protein LOC120996577 [Bufo bufo]
MAGFALTDDPFIGVKGFIYTSGKKMTVSNFQKDLLVAHPEEGTAIFESDVDAGAEQATFYLETYKEIGDGNSIPVAISCQIGSTNYLLCIESNSVILKETELPEEIPEEASEYIFYKRDCDDENVTFESSVERGFCLGCSEDDQCLVLKPYLEDEFDASKAFLLKYSLQESFKINTGKKHPYNFQNIHEDLLVAHPKESAVTFDSVGDVKAENTTFYMNVYSELGPNEGLPVTISCKVDDKNYFLCVDSDSVILKEGELPEVIPANTSELIFYAKAFANGTSSLRFESSSVKDFCIAWNSTDSKVILKQYSENNLDETIKMCLTERD